jgi:Putative transposase
VEPSEHAAALERRQLRRCDSLGPLQLQTYQLAVLLPEKPPQDPPDGRLELELKSVWKDGTRAILLEPHDLLIRLCASVPAPRLHLVRYFGVLSSHHALRAEVTPTAAPEPGMFKPAAAPGDQQSLPLGPPDAGQPRAGRARWGWLIGHVFLADVEHCSRCSGPLRWVEAATTPEAISRLLAKHGLGPRPPPPSRSPPIPEGQLSFAFARSAR